MAWFEFNGPSKSEMEVLGHEAKSEESHRNAFAGVSRQLEEGTLISVLVKDGASSVASVEDVVAATTPGSPSSAWHENQSWSDIAGQARRKYDGSFCVPIKGPDTYLKPFHPLVSVSIKPRA
jgi:hypothetical protein